MGTILRTSEFWVAIVTAIGGVVVTFMPAWKPIWDQMVMPALVYILGRLLGKAAKAVSPTP